MTQTTNQPSAEEFREFAASRRMLFAECAELAANVSILKDHSVYRWLKDQPGYEAAEASICKKESFRSATLPVRGAQEADYELLYFAMFVAQCLAIYFDLLRAHPDERKDVITSRDLHEARDAAAVLRGMIERGLVLQDQSVLDLYTLLENIPESTDGLLTTSERAGSHVPAMALIRTLALLLHSHYNEMMPAVIYHVVSMVEPVPNRESLERTIKRHLAILRGDT